MDAPHEDLAERRDVLLARGGDEAAFARLVARHARRLHDLARRMLRDAAEAEDAVQHAFWNAWRAMPRFDPDRPLGHWLLVITSNLCRNRLAARRRRRERARGGEDPGPDIPAPPAPPPAEGSAKAADALLERLPETYRMAMILRYRMGLPLEEIAEVTGEGIATVKTHLHRGRSALRLLLGGEGETGADGEGTRGRT